jgi:hypothetical protein
MAVIFTNLSDSQITITTYSVTLDPDESEENATDFDEVIQDSQVRSLIEAGSLDVTSLNRTL